MVITTFRLNKAQIATANGLFSDLNSIAVGDSTTTPDETDTDLGNQTYIDTIYSKSVLSNVVNADLRLDVTENNGNTINEIGLKDSSGNLDSHNLTTSFVKTSDKEAYYRLKTTFTAVNKII